MDMLKYNQQSNNNFLGVSIIQQDSESKSKSKELRETSGCESILALVLLALFLLLRRK